MNENHITTEASIHTVKNIFTTIVHSRLTELDFCESVQGENTSCMLGGYVG